MAQQTITPGTVAKDEENLKQAYDKINSNFTELYNSNANVQGTVTGNLIPDTNDAYDLGSAEYKFRDLYLSDSTIHTASGNLSTIGGVFTYNGDPVIVLSSLKQAISESSSWEEFKTYIEEL